MVVVLKNTHCNKNTHKFAKLLPLVDSIKSSLLSHDMLAIPMLIRMMMIGMLMT